jgi:CRP-like cAMP-binding protein
MENLERLIAEHPFFGDLEPRYFQILVGCAANVRFDPGQFIFRMGEAADRFYLIRHGRVAVEVYLAERGAVVLQTLGPGDVLGWSWFVPPYRWRFDARAVELTRAVAMDGACLRQKCQQDHGLGYQLLRRIATVMAQRLESARLQLVNMYGPHR